MNEEIKNKEVNKSIPLLCVEAIILYVMRLAPPSLLFKSKHNSLKNTTIQRKPILGEKFSLNLHIHIILKMIV